MRRRRNTSASTMMNQDNQCKRQQRRLVPLPCTHSLCILSSAPITMIVTHRYSTIDNDEDHTRLLSSLSPSSSSSWSSSSFLLVSFLLGDEKFMARSEVQICRIFPVSVTSRCLSKNDSSSVDHDTNRNEIATGRIRQRRWRQHWQR